MDSILTLKYTIYNENLTILSFQNADKEATTIIKRLASCVGAISDTRHIHFYNKNKEQV